MENKTSEYMKQLFDQKFIVLFFFFRQEGYNVKFGWNFLSQIVKIYFRFN